MKLFTNSEVEKWRDQAYQWQESSKFLHRQLTNADDEIRRLQRQIHDLQQQNYQLSQQIKRENPFDRSQLRLILEILQRLPKAIKPLRKLKTKSGVEIILLDKQKVEDIIQEFVENPKGIIRKLAALGIIKKKDGYVYPCRVDGHLVRGYALVRERAMWYVYESMKPLISEEE